MSEVADYSRQRESSPLSPTRGALTTQTSRVIAINPAPHTASYITVNVSLRARYGTATDLLLGMARVWA